MHVCIYIPNTKLFSFQSETNDTLYYQWVVFMLAINAILFKIPHLLWKSFEGGLMKKFHSGKGLKSDLMNADGDMEEHLQTHIAYFKKLSKKSGKNITYYAQFQTCQLLNIMMLVLNFWATHQFLPSSSSSGFSSYGSDVVNYLTTDADELDSTNPGPMCLTFPTVVRINIILKTFCWLFLLHCITLYYA